MKTNMISNTLLRFAIFLTVIVAVDAMNSVPAQSTDPVPQTDFFKMDFNGDRQVDLVFRTPGSSKWIIQNLDGTVDTASIGAIDAVPAAADYDGDHIEDMASVTSKEGFLIWQIRRSSDGVDVNVQWGLLTDVLVQGDYDGDGLADPAVFRPSEAIWYVLASSSGEMFVYNWGTPTDKAMPGDYDGDGQTDVCVFRPKTSTFYYLSSKDDQMYEQMFGPFVITGFETFVSADFDGDGITDFATYDTSVGGMWVILESATGKYNAASLLGSSPICTAFAPEPCTVSDFAVPADYDHDGVVDPAIWDSKNAVVKVFTPKGGLMEIRTQTTADMIPVSSFYMTR